MFKNVLLSLTSILITTTTIPNYKNKQLTKILTNNEPITKVINANNQKHIIMSSKNYSPWRTYYSPDAILLDYWNNYACNWNNFLKKYPTINFTNSDLSLRILAIFLKEKIITINYHKEITNFQKSTNDIKPKSVKNNIFYYLYFKKEITLTAFNDLEITTKMESWIKIWHDNNHIYWNYAFKINCHFSEDIIDEFNVYYLISKFSLKLDTVTFK